MIFERFTDGARLANAIANQMCGEFNHTETLPEHLLYAILCRPEARLIALLEAMEIDAVALKTAAKNAMRHGSRKGPWGKQPLAPVTKQIYQTAVDEADHLGHVEVNSAHLLLGLLIKTQPPLQVLVDVGLTAGLVRDTTRRLFPPSRLTEATQLKEEAAAKHREALRDHEQRAEADGRNRLLQEQISNWQYAKMICSFVQEVKQTASNRGIVITDGSELDLWLKWAEQHAAAVDPIAKVITPEVTAATLDAS